MTTLIFLILLAVAIGTAVSVYSSAPDEYVGKTYESEDLFKEERAISFDPIVERYDIESPFYSYGDSD